MHSDQSQIITQSNRPQKTGRAVDCKKRPSNAVIEIHEFGEKWIVGNHQSLQKKI
jgi:hypothetical protein